MWAKSIVLGGVVLAIAGALQFRGAFESRATAASPALHGLLSVPVQGWAVRDLPIGDTELVKEVSANTLRYDDYCFREYRRGETVFTVYVAYWAPGKHPPQMIAQHVPDRCWTMNGMICEEMRFNVPAAIGGKTLWPAQWRKFREPSGDVVYTMFWHMVGDRPYDFGERFYDMPGPVTYWSEAIRFAVGAQPEQHFFRITSNVSPEQIWNEPGFQQAVHGFLQLGLVRRER